MQDFFGLKDKFHKCSSVSMTMLRIVCLLHFLAVLNRMVIAIINVWII